MKKSVNIVLIGVLTVASIILALPFTPLRNSFKGVTSSVADKALNGLGVDLNGKIKNARQISAAHQYEVSNMNLGLIVDSKGRIISSVNGGNNGVIADNYNLSAFVSGSAQNSTAIGGAGANFSSLGKANSKSGSQSVGGFVAISTKLGTTSTSTSNTGTSSTTTRQGDNSSNNGTGGGTHPGVDPSGPPGPSPSLPLGDASTGFLLFAGVFVAVKTRKFF